MDKVKSSVNRVKVKIVKKALDKVKNLDERYSWTIHFLIDLKVVYIITYAYITIVNLISSTANSEATSDANGMSLFNVTSSPEYTNVEVDSISDAILWNCRRQSVTKQYYRFLYWALILAMSAALLLFFATKFIALITVSCICKNFNKYVLTKLWHIAVLEELKDRAKEELKDRAKEELKDRAKDQSRLLFPLKNYQTLINENISQDSLKSLKTSCTNYCRLVIPGILLWFCVVILGLSYLSYDLHPLACISQPKEELIKYNSTTKRVELEFSDKLPRFQRGVGITVLVLIPLYLFFALLFYLFSKKVISDLKPKAKNIIDHHDQKTKARQIINHQETAV